MVAIERELYRMKVMLEEVFNALVALPHTTHNTPDVFKCMLFLSHIKTI